MRLTGKLSAKKVAKLLHKGEPGNWHDGQGLRLEIRSANSGILGHRATNCAVLRTGWA